MRYHYFLFILALVTMYSCSKDGEGKYDLYIVSASKMIGIKSSSWDKVEPQLKNKAGYQYNRAADNLMSILKATVDFPATDDSNRAVKGRILLNIAPDNRIFHASFDTEPLAKGLAYALLLNYNRQTIITLTNIISSIGSVQQNGRGGNDRVDVVLAKIVSGEEADQLGITYKSNQGEYTMVVFRQPDGRYVFSYR